MHFSNELPREFYEQLTAEQRVLARVNGREAYRWIKRRPRNEQLDNRNYAMHAAMGLGLHKYTDAQWQRLEAMVQPPADLFSMPVQLEEKTPIPAHPAKEDSYKNSSTSHTNASTSTRKPARKPTARHW